MKNIDAFILDEKPPLTVLSWDHLISEDMKNSSKKIYDKDIFKNMECFKISEDNEKEEDIEEKEEKEKEEERKKKFEDFLNKIDKLGSRIESNTNIIRRDMEQDEEKRKEIEKQEKLRKEKEEKEERERKQREEELKRQKEEEIKKQQEEMRRKKEEERRQMELNMQNNDILGNGGTVRERLIKAAKNFENIKKEVDKINKNNDLMSKTEKIYIKINQEIGKVTSIEDINKINV